jgi:excisionase family DNA binding protein
MKATQSSGAGIEGGNGQYLRRKEIADRLGVTERTIDLWRATRGLPHYKPGGRVYFIGKEVEAWFRAKRRRGGTRWRAKRVGDALEMNPAGGTLA